MTAIQVEVASKRDLLTALDAAEREHEQALTAWRALGARQAELRGANKLTTINGRERHLDDVERAAALLRFEGERGPAAERLLAARARLAAAKRDHANSVLLEVGARWQGNAEAAQAARTQLERALAALIVAAESYDEARRDEEGAARECVRAALSALDDDAERATLRADAARSVPVEVTAEGVRTIDRPEATLFDGPADPRSAATWTGLARVLAEPQRAQQLLAGTKLGALVQKVAKRAEDKR
jgi:hypothetical protein